jgi:hypothetical protein
MQAELFGVRLSWIAPETQPLHYNLYRYGNINKEDVIIEVNGNATSYLDESGLGQFKHQLTAVYEDCESDFALTPDGEDFVNIQVTGIEENSNDEIVSVTRIYTMSGQCLKHSDINALSNGVYLIQGLTEEGKLISRKIILNKE